MIRVKNRKVIGNLSKKSLRANKVRNIIAIAAIVLTTMLFTALFTIAATILNSFEQNNFRQAGGSFHGTFKYITREQAEELSQDPLITKWGSSLILGMPTDQPFNKAHVEVRYMDQTSAENSFCMPTHGSLPQEGTDEAAVDTRILNLLGVEPKIGAKITLTYYVGNAERIPVTETFTLSGWCEYDEAKVASMVIVPRSYAEKIAQWYEPQRPKIDDQSCTWVLDVFLKNSRNIDGDLKSILANHGYQNEDKLQDNYIGTGVNWGYVGAQMSQKMDPGTMMAMAALLLLIAFTGYLIINNIFRISVSNDIRFYGLLKTIGTTGKQIKRMIRRQALSLCIIGIPIGLLAGYLVGHILAPIAMSNFSVTDAYMSANPLIFLGAILFSLLTVLISCGKPGKMAARVSPVEAVRYTEGSSSKKAVRRGESGGKISRMALANLGRSKSRTILVIVSLSLTVVLLQVTATFTTGFDMDKYLNKFVVSDFIFGGANYFQVGTGGFSQESQVEETDIAAIESQGGIAQGGRIYGQTFGAEGFIPEDYYRERWKGYWTEEEIRSQMSASDRLSNGQVADDITLYGMEKTPLDYLEVVDGDLSDVYDPEKKSIAAVYFRGDYGDVEMDSNWAKVGDRVTVWYVDEWEYVDPESGEVIPPEALDADPDRPSAARAAKYREETYTVAACVTMRSSMSYRYYGAPEFILNDQVFMKDTQTSSIMTYLFDTTEESNGAMEEFLQDYTEKVNPATDFESKQSYASEFYGFRNMFVMMGGVLSLVVGIVGILNFLNAILTSIVTRRREFAMLQSIGMTGRQLKSMLVWEGVLYALIASVISLVLGLATGPLMGKVMGSMFWFFTYHFTILPILIMTPVFILLGVILPLISYKFTNKQTIVERLRIE